MPSANKQILQGATVPLHCEFSMNYFTVYLTGGSSLSALKMYQEIIGSHTADPESVIGFSQSLFKIF